MPNRPSEHSPTLTVDEVATLICVSRSTAHDLIATDEPPTVRRRILVPASALADLLGVSLAEIYSAPSIGYIDPCPRAPQSIVCQPPW